MTEREAYHQAARALGHVSPNQEVNRLIDRLLSLESRAATIEFRRANKIRAMAVTKAHNDARRIA